mmetsp:Transcript_98294/g.174218  ORF Transcript_98294/g.174218 Transcript_98294/m.174218 type:complete len:129 (+) Transcript_98294:1902-2288(+)
MATWHRAARCTELAAASGVRHRSADHLLRRSISRFLSRRSAEVLAAARVTRCAALVEHPSRQMRSSAGSVVQSALTLRRREETTNHFNRSVTLRQDEWSLEAARKTVWRPRLPEDARSGVALFDFFYK